jgi:murein tripeptide amidase MpaA
MDDFGYDHYGWFGFTIELWDAPTQAGIEKEDYIRWYGWHPLEDDLLLMKWNDEQLGGTGFIPWQPFDHPQLGTVEIGGWDEKAVWQNAPAQYLPEICEKQANFAIAHALMSPKLAIAQIKITPQGSDIYHLVIQIENQGFLPTYTSKKSLERKAVRAIEVMLSLPEGVTLISGQREQNIDHLEGRSNKAFSSFVSSGGGIDYRRHLEWVIKGPAKSELEIMIYSERAGTIKTQICLDN